jgi:hypothetical protein
MMRDAGFCCWLRYRRGMTAPLPVPRSYWIVPGRLLAGEYPSDADPRVAAERLQRFRSAGIGLFVDLTEPLELEPYSHLVGDARHERRPIPDLGTISRRRYREILDLVDSGVGSGDGVYVHCWQGLGRTGTVVGCWLVRHGFDGGDPLARIAGLRQGLPDAGRSSPQTASQRRMVARWRRGE